MLRPGFLHRALPTLNTVLRDLVDPLWLPSATLVGVWVVLWRSGALRGWMKIVGTTALAWSWIIATPFGALVAERPLVVESTIEDDWRPDYIYVLSAGFELADLPEGDSPGLETVRRVNRAVVLWREYPTATLIMAGLEPGKLELRTPDRLGVLMREHAQRLGVPAGRIRIDSVSTNTNGHAKVARDSGLHGADAPIAIVTSDFHLRRSRREFSRFFTDVRMVGSDPAVTDPTFGGLGVGSFLPQTKALTDSATYLREYVALLLSDLRN